MQPRRRQRAEEDGNLLSQQQDAELIAFIENQKKQNHQNETASKQLSDSFLEVLKDQILENPVSSSSSSPLNYFKMNNGDSETFGSLVREMATTTTRIATSSDNNDVCFTSQSHKDFSDFQKQFRTEKAKRYYFSKRVEQFEQEEKRQKLIEEGNEEMANKMSVIIAKQQRQEQKRLAKRKRRLEMRRGNKLHNTHLPWYTRMNQQHQQNNFHNTNLFNQQQQQNQPSDPTAYDLEAAGKLFIPKKPHERPRQSNLFKSQKTAERVGEQKSKLQAAVQLREEKEKEALKRFAAMLDGQ